MTIAEFEAAVLAQKPTGQQHYDENYWLGEWRAERPRHVGYILLRDQTRRLTIFELVIYCSNANA